MNQAQKTRWLKTTAIVVFLIFLFYYLSPRGVDIYQGSPGGGMLRPPSVVRVNESPSI